MSSELGIILFIQVILLYMVLVQGNLMLYCPGLMGKSYSGTSGVSSPVVQYCGRGFVKKIKYL